MFSFSCPSINFSTEVISANLELLEEDAMVRLVNPSVKGGKNGTFFVASENFRLRLVIGHTVFFTSEKNRTIKQIACTLQRIIFI